MDQRDLADRLGDLAPLSAAERAALERLEGKRKTLRRGAVLLRENDRLSDLFALNRGLMMDSVLLNDGSRQIVSFHSSGCLMATTAFAYRTSPQSIVALTDCEVSPIDRAALAAVMVEYPRLAILIGALIQIDLTVLTDRLAGVGRTSARSRVAALLLVVRDRQRSLDQTVTDSFTLGLTQEEMGDATGLTAVHVNRMLRELERDGQIARDNGKVTLLRESELAGETHYANRYEGLDFSWLPPPA